MQHQLLDILLDGKMFTLVLPFICRRQFKHLVENRFLSRNEKRNALVLGSLFLIRALHL